MLDRLGNWERQYMNTWHTTVVYILGSCLFWQDHFFNADTECAAMMRFQPDLDLRARCEDR